MSGKPVKVTDVFVAGGQPTITYNPRDSLRLEERLREYLDTGHKLLSITGPTKCGKSVLCKSVIPEDKGIWVYGGEVQKEDDFWNAILDRLQQPTVVNRSETIEDSLAGQGELAAELSVLGAFRGSVRFGDSMGARTTQSISRTQYSTPRAAALRALREAQLPLVVDDFHYIHREVQASIIRALKNLIADGLRVIVLAVPHRAYDPVRVETEMTGRVANLTIPLWESSELLGIPQKGFAELNAEYPVEFVKRLADESFGSPHLMQEFCLKLCLENGFKERQETRVILQPPADEGRFFGEIAEPTQKLSFERLARGPRQRKDRKQRQFVDGSRGDIYTAVLRAIADTGPKTKLTYEEIRQALRSVLAESVPQAQEIGRVLTQMDRIAKQLEGEPVLEWDRETSTLYISDPFFAFYLRWGTKQV